MGLSLSLALLISAAWWLGHEALHRTADAYVVSRLMHDAEALLTSLEVSPQGLVQVRPPHLSPIYDEPDSGHYFTLRIVDGATARSRSLGDFELKAPNLSPGVTAHWHTAGPRGQDLLTLGGGFRHQGHDLTLVVAEDFSPVRRPLRSFEQLFALMAVGGLIAMLWVQRRIVRRAFACLRPVYRDIVALERGEASTLTEVVPAEILPLVSKINGLLTLYAKRLERSRNVAGNLAHALKGPLTLMTQTLDTQPTGSEPATQAVLREQLARVGALLERELKRARLAGAGSPGLHFDPQAELPVLKRLLERMYPDQDLSLECRLDLSGVLAADREDMLELIGTLLDNACKWAQTRVSCFLMQTPDGVRLCIEDDGPGCPEAELDAIAQRGVRLDESVAGHGLGLSIVREIVDLYGGRLELGRSTTLGGLRAAVSLPVRCLEPTS